MEISIRNGVAMVGKSSGVLYAAYLVVGSCIVLFVGRGFEYMHGIANAD